MDLCAKCGYTPCACRTEAPAPSDAAGRSLPWLDLLRHSVAVPVPIREGITLDDLLARLREEVAKVGQQAWAKAHGVSPQYLNDVLKRRRDPGPKILKAMHLRADTRYLKDPPPVFRGSTYF